MKEWLGNLRRRYRSVKNLVEWMCPPIDLVSVFFVLADGDAVEIDSRKNAAATRPSQQFCSHTHIGRCLRVAPHRTSCRRCVAADLELVVQQILESFLVYGD